MTKTRKLRNQRIRTKLKSPSLRISGWLDGQYTALRIDELYSGEHATLRGRKLYRLAKAICARFENAGK